MCKSLVLRIVFLASIPMMMEYYFKMEKLLLIKNLPTNLASNLAMIL